MIDLLGILLTLVLSAFYSGSETALVSANRLKFEALRRLGSRTGKRVVKLLEEPDRFLTICVVGTNIAVVAWSSLVAIKLEPVMASSTIVLVSATVMLIFGEILPKTLGRSLADRSAGWIAAGVAVSEVLLYPMVWFVRAVGRVLAKLFGAKPGGAGMRFLLSRRDLEYLLASSEGMAPVEEEERAFITRVFRLGHQRVRDIMIPRTEIEAVRIDEPLAKVIQKFKSTGYSRLLVYGDNLDDVRGFVHVLDLLKKPERWQDVIRPVLAVPESLSSVELLRRMQREKKSIAVVVDEYGGTEGLVTLEDLVEQLFGEIQDEFDNEERLVRRLGPRSFVVSARAEVASLNETFGLNLPEGDYVTIGGLLTERAGRIPAPNEELVVGEWRIRVLSSSPKRVEWVRLDPVRQDKPQRGVLENATSAKRGTGELT